MKKQLLISVLLLFVGVSVQAQSVSEGQMDERFNDGTKMPFGWFAEGRRHQPLLRPARTPAPLG